MKNLKKIVALVLALVMVCAMMLVSHAVEPRSTTMPCSCGGTITVHVSVDEYEEEEECTHASSSGTSFAGYDVYRVIERTVYESCDTCGYSDTDTTTSRHLISCPNK